MRIRTRLTALWAAAILAVSLVAAAGPATAADPELPSPQIVGGGPADPNAYPFMVALVSSNSNDAWAGQYCGGSLIAAEWVLTAAHCAEGSNPNSVDLVIGRYDLRSSDGERIGAAEIHIHPEYNTRTLDNDVALIKLETASAVAPIGGLATSANASLWDAGTMATVMGWGFTESSPSYPEVLYEVDVPIMSDATCTSLLGNEYFADSMLCAGEIGGGVDSCYGDSGGPLVVPNGNDYVVAGIVSWGYGCADPGNPGVYSRVAAFESWINDIVGDPGDPPPPPPPPPTGDGDVMVSTSADLSNAVNLDGATVSGTIYVFLANDDGVTNSVFRLNGTRVNRDRSAPFMLNEGSYDSSQLGNGSNELSVTIRGSNGRQTFTADFTVSN